VTRVLPLEGQPLAVQRLGRALWAAEDAAAARAPATARETRRDRAPINCCLARRSNQVAQILGVNRSRVAAIEVTAAPSRAATRRYLAALADVETNR